MKIGLTALLGIFFFSAAPARADQTDELQRRLAFLNERITTLIGDASCTSDSQCRAIGFGAKPCGGVVTYLPYSTAETNPMQLRAWVNAYNATQKRLNDLLGLISDCRFVVPPETLVCQRSRCVIP